MVWRECAQSDARRNDCDPEQNYQRDLAEPAIVARITELGGVPMVRSPSELDAFVVAETDKWAKVVKFSGAQLD